MFCGRFHCVCRNTCDDSVTVIDLKKLEAADRVDLGGPTEISKHRRGERLFHSANIAFRRQFSWQHLPPRWPH